MRLQCSGLLPSQRRTFRQKMSYIQFGMSQIAPREDTYQPIEILREAPPLKSRGHRQLCLQLCRFEDDRERAQYGYRFVWRAEDGNLDDADAQAIIPHLEEACALVDMARAEGWGQPQLAGGAPVAPQHKRQSDQRRSQGLSTLELNIPEKRVLLKAPAWLLLVLLPLVLLALWYYAAGPEARREADSRVLAALDILRRDREYVGDGYVVRRTTHQGLVDGLVGDWYEIDVRDTQNKGRLSFGLGSTEEFLGVGRFAQVMEKVRSDLQYDKAGGKLFLLGSADSTSKNSFANRWLQEQRQMTVLPRKAGHKYVYINTPKVFEIPPVYTNVHLPNLRSAFVQRCLREIGREATILDGVVTDRQSSYDRAVRVLLYIPSPPRSGNRG